VSPRPGLWVGGQRARESRHSAVFCFATKRQSGQSGASRPFHKPGAGCIACPRCWRSRRTAFARHVRSSTRRTRTRSPRLSLRLRERLCSRRAVGRRPLVSTNSGHVFAADPVAASVRKEPRPTAKKARQRGRAPSVPAIAARSIQRFASLSAVAGSSWCRSRGRWAAVRPQARRGFAGASRHR
jgi:hypothetical protein